MVLVWYVSSSLTIHYPLLCIIPVYEISDMTALNHLSWKSPLGQQFKIHSRGWNSRVSFANPYCSQESLPYCDWCPLDWNLFLFSQLWILEGKIRNYSGPPKDLQDNCFKPLILKMKNWGQVEYVTCLQWELVPKLTHPACQTSALSVALVITFSHTHTSVT